MRAGRGRVGIRGRDRGGTAARFGVLRLTPEGTFEYGGVDVTRGENRWDYGRAVALRPDGRAVVAGESSPVRGESITTDVGRRGAHRRPEAAARPRAGAGGRRRPRDVHRLRQRRGDVARPARRSDGAGHERRLHHRAEVQGRPVLRGPAAGRDRQRRDEERGRVVGGAGALQEDRGCRRPATTPSTSTPT
jgi:hypothetical protein